MRTPEEDTWAQLAHLWDATVAGRSGSEVGAFLLRALDAGPHLILRTAAAEALSLVLASDLAGLPAVLARLQHPNAAVRWRVAWLLGRLPPPAPLVVDALIGCMRDPSPEVRARAASALGRLGVDSPPVIESLLRAVGTPFPFSDGDAGADGGTEPEPLGERGAWWWWDLREWAADALGWLPAAATPEVLDVLLGAIRDLHDGGGPPEPIVGAVRRLVAGAPPLQAAVCARAADTAYPFHYQAGWFCRELPAPLPDGDAQSAGPFPTSDEIAEHLARMGSHFALLSEAPTPDLGAPAGVAAGRALLATAHALVTRVGTEAAGCSRLLALLPKQPAPAQALVLTLLVHRLAAPCPSGWTATRLPPLIERAVRPPLLALLQAPDALTRRLALSGVAALDGAALHGWGDRQRHTQLDWWQVGGNLAMIARWMEAISYLTVTLLEALRPESTIRSQAASRAQVLDMPAMREGNEALLGFLRQLEADLYRLREYALAGLGVVRPGFAGIADPHLIATLVEVAGDAAGRTRQRREQAVILLKLLGPNTPAVRAVLQACLGEDDQLWVRVILKALVAVAGPSQESYAAISAALGTADAFTRAAAIEAAVCLGEVPLELFVSIRSLIGIVEPADEFGSVDPAARRAFIAVRVPDCGTPDQWDHLLTDPQPWIRLTAAKMLIALGVADRAVPDVLLSNLHGDPAVAEAAIALLGAHGSREPRIVATLLDLLHKAVGAADHGLSTKIVPVLGCLGVGRRPALEALYAQLHADDFLAALPSAESEVACALIALAQSDMDAAATLLLRLLPRFPRLPLRVQAVLPSLDAPDAVAVLLRVAQRDYQETDWSPWREVAALGQVAAAAPAVTAALLDHQRSSSDPRFRAHVIGWLGRRGRAEPEILAALLAAMEEDDLEVCEAATIALGVLVPGAAVAAAAARTRLARLHGPAIASTLAAAVEKDPVGSGFENATPPRPLPNGWDRDFLGERMRRIRWR